MTGFDPLARLHQELVRRGIHCDRHAAVLSVWMDLLVRVSEDGRVFEWFKGDKLQQHRVDDVAEAAEEVAMQRQRLIAAHPDLWLFFDDVDSA